MGRIEEGKAANLVAYTGNPLRTSSKIDFIAIHDKVECKPVEEI